MRSCDALALGSMASSNGATVNVVTAAALAKLTPAQRGNGTIARTREHIAFRAGAPAWLLLDFDRKGMPPHVAGKIEAAGGLWPALLNVAPGLAQAARVTRASTSAGLWRSDTGERFATLGLGFQMGAERFVDAAEGYGVLLNLDEAARHVAQWRRDHPMIVGLWLAMEETVKAIAQGPVGDEAEVGRCLIYRRPGSVRIRLPSGRELIYHAMTLVERAGSLRGGGELAFMGPHPLSRKWTQQRTYGGKLVENITQAVARDVLAEGMLVLHVRGRQLLGSVHDEVLLEAGVADAEGLLEETLALLRTPPSWAEGLPVEAEGFVSPRYRKA